MRARFRRIWIPCMWRIWRWLALAARGMRRRGIFSWRNFVRRFIARGGRLRGKRRGVSWRILCTRTFMDYGKRRGSERRCSIFFLGAQQVDDLAARGIGAASRGRNSARAQDRAARGGRGGAAFVRQFRCEGSPNFGGTGGEPLAAEIP